MIAFAQPVPAAAPSSSWSRTRLPALIAAGLVLAVYFQGLPLNLGLFWRDAFDGRLILWILEHGRQKLLAGDLLGYFDAIQFYPYRNSLAFSDSLIGLSPIHTLWRLVAPEIVALNLSLMTVLVLAVLALDRQLKALAIAPGARILAVVIGLSSFPISAVMGHFQLFGLLFAPAILILVYRVLVAGERGLWPEMLALTAFGGAIAMYLPFMLFFLLAPIALIYWRDVLRLPAALTRRDIVAILVFLVAMALLIRPYLGLHGGFPPIPLAELHLYAGRLLSFFVQTPPNFVYPPPPIANGDWERSYSPGAIGIICFGAATVLVARALRRAPELASQRRLLLFAGLIFLLAFGLALGPFVELFGKTIPTPVGALQKWVPSLRVIRTPGRYSIFLPLFIALVFAIGMGLPGLRRQIAVLALVFCVFQVPRSDLVAKQIAIPRADACLERLTRGDVAAVVPLVAAGHIEWIEARLENMLLMLPYKARIFDGYGNRDTPEIGAVTHLERVFRAGEIDAQAYRAGLARLGATHLVLRKGMLPPADERRFDAFSAIACDSPLVSLRRLSDVP